MKNDWNTRSWAVPLPKLDLKMKMTALLLLTAILTLHANDGYAQKTKISLDVENMTTASVIDEIENISDFRFVYLAKSVDLDRKVTLKIKQVRIEKILGLLFDQTDTDYTIENTQILLKKKDNANPDKMDNPKIQPQFAVSGTVTDQTGTPLPGVTIRVKAMPLGTATDFDGRYSITVPGPDHILVFSSVGYATQEMTIGQRTTINIQLEEAVSELNEVVLNAGYYTVSERERTGSISTINSGIIEKQPSSNPLSAMQGHMSGVNIVQSTGVPGGGFDIEIRGRNFLNGVGEPLFIVDGVPFGSQSLGSTSVSSLIFAGNISPLNAINPNDIKSIEVLKDADATAIYGSRGANGVVLITTKKGRPGKTRFDTHLSTSFGSVSHFLDLMNTTEYLEVRREGIVNDGYGDLLNNPAFDFIWPEIKTWDSDRYTDWQEKLIGGTAYRNMAQLSVSGGSERTQFLVSGAFQKETTVFPGNSNYKKASVHSNLNHRSENSRFRFNFSTGFTHEVNRMPAADFSLSAYTMEPNAPRLYDDQGNLNWENNTWDNPLASLEETYGVETKTFRSNAVISYELLPNLILKSNLGFTRYRLDSRRILPSSARNPGDGYTPQTWSSLTTNGSSRESWIVEPQISWKKRWNVFSLNVLVGTSFQEETTQQLVQQGRGFPSDNLIQNLAAAESLEVFEDINGEYRYSAVFGRANLKFLDRYILNITGRRDGSSRFGPGKQFGNFGAIGLAWLFSNEQFLVDSPFLSYGKLRGSYGTTGSDNIGDYRFLDTYDVTGQEYDGTTVLEPSGIFNPQFGWEENKKLELALELGFFRDRLLLNTSLYRNRSSNQLVGIPLANTTGFSQLTGNFDATVENTGLEVDLSSINIKTDRFSWSTNFNITVPRNKLVSFDGLETSTFANRYIIGEPLTIVKLYRSHGVNPETGSYDIEDYNGDGQISSLEDRQWVEDLAPELYGGLGNTLALGNFSLDFFFQFKKQRTYNIMAFRATPGFGNNMPKAMLDRWREVGDEATYQRAAGGLSLIPGTGPFQEVSNLAVSDASFIRLRNISLNYQVPTDNGLEFNIYLQGQNLMTFTSYDGPDPEQPSNTRLPALRQITLGLQFSF